MSRRLIAAVAATLALSACADDTSPRTGPSALPSATESAPVTPSAPASPTATPSTPSATPAARTRVPVYYLGRATHQNRPVLFREFRSVPATSGVVRAAVDSMLHLAPLDADYFSLWPAGTRVNGVSINGTVATVDLSESARTVRADRREEQQSIQQLVYTVTAAAPTVRSVRLRFDGRTRPTLWGSVDTTRDLTRASQVEALAAIWVIEPTYGSRVSRRFTVKGTATVFEATVSWTVTRAGTGLPIADGFVTASEGAPGRGNFTVNVTLPQGTTGDIVFKAYESSAEDGRETNADTKTYRVA